MDFDNVYRMGTTDGYYGPPEPDFEHCLQMIEDLGSVGVALEIGCGDGRHARVLCRRGWQTMGVDLSIEGIESARAACGSLFTGIRADGRTVFLNARFDLVVAATFIDHVGLDDVVRAIRILKNRCRGGGYLYITATNSWDPENTHSDRSYRGLAEQGSETGSAFVSFFDPGWLMAQLADWEILHYAEIFSLALHAPPHSHGFSVVCARAPR